MKKIYIPYWFRSGELRGECYQTIEVDGAGGHRVVGYCDDAGNPFTLPDPHEGVLVNPRAPLDRPPHMLEPELPTTSVVVFPDPPQE